MLKNEALTTITNDLYNKRLSNALAHLTNYLSTFTIPQAYDQLSELKKDYQLMIDYWKQGYNDPLRSELYMQLLQRAYAITANVNCRFYINNNNYVNTIYRHARAEQTDRSVSAFKKQLEDYVSETAMLQLMPEHIRKDKYKALNTAHYQVKTTLFDYIWTSRIWNEEVAQGFQQLLLSPTIDSADQQLLISAITIAAINFFDINKFRLLVNIYLEATNTQVKQRALVGWVLATETKAASLYPEIQQLIDKVTENEQCREELTELQIQMFYCIKADSDNRIIQSEIMPHLMQSGFRLDNNGKLTEAEEDSLEDALNPEQSEQRMEQLEASMKRMNDMLQQGSDVYFGGFSQMKRFAFFTTMAHWFMPFSFDHPGIAESLKPARGAKMLKTILKTTPFCDSDKYSFVLAFQKSMDHLPDSAIQMIERGEAMIAGANLNTDDMHTPAFVRRNYLQDLYRFYRIFPHRSDFVNPFDFPEKEEQNFIPRFLFFASPLFIKSLPIQSTFQMVSYLLKHKSYDSAAKILTNIPKENQSIQFYLLNASLLSSSHKQLNAGLTVYECYQEALKLEPDNHRAWAGMARAAFNKGEYKTALDYYQRLNNLSSNKLTYQLGTAACLSSLQQYDEALKILYKLNYEDPNNSTVNSILAWTLTGSSKYEQALKIYDGMMATGKVEANDMLNYAYCLWFNKNVEKAADTFRQYAHSKDYGFDPSNEFRKEAEFLAIHGITSVEVYLMLELLNE